MLGIICFALFQKSVTFHEAFGPLFQFSGFFNFHIFRHRDLDGRGGGADNPMAVHMNIQGIVSSGNFRTIKDFKISRHFLVSNISSIFKIRERAIIQFSTVSVEMASTTEEKSCGTR